MGIFGQSSPFDADIEKATSETNTNENWSLILDVCDKVSSRPGSAKECLRAIMKRMGHADPHIVMQAITLLDACVSNCGKSFHLEIASRDFENEFRRLLAKAQPKVSLKMRQVLKNWAENDFKNDPELNLIPSLYVKLRHEGCDFSNLNEKPQKSAAAAAAKAAAALKDPNVVSSQQEEDDIAKAIELSLKEVKQSPKHQGGAAGGGGGAGASMNAASSAAYPSLYPSFAGPGGTGSGTGTASAATASSNNAGAAAPQPEARKVRALYDFEAAEENEMTFYAGEIIHVLDDSDPNWWKGYNQRGEGLFPSNFVTADLNAEPERLDGHGGGADGDSSKAGQFAEDSLELQQKTEAAAAAVAAANQRIEIDELKVDRLLHLLHEANPEDPSQDTDEMLLLEQQVHQMGPLIDAELERVDRKHAQLTQLSSDLVDAINLYHSLMRDDRAGLMAGAYMGAAGMPPMGMAGGAGGVYGAQLPNPQMLYGAAGYSSAHTTPGGAVGGGSYGAAGMGMPAMPYVTQANQAGNSVVPTATPTLPSQTTSAAIPMQYQNGHGNTVLSQYMRHVGHIPPGAETQPPLQQQQHQMGSTFAQAAPQPPQPQPSAATTTVTATGPQTVAYDQQHLHQQQSLQQHQNNSYMHGHQQQSYPTIHQNGLNAYMHLPSSPAAAGLAHPPPQHMQQQTHPHQHQPQHPQQHPPNTNNQPTHPMNMNHNVELINQLQNHMSSMSMQGGGGGVGSGLGAAAGVGVAVGHGAINQSEQNYHILNEPKNDIPIYQQQR